MPDVTQILHAIDSGDAKAAGELLPLVYEELRKLAAQRMRAESPDHTLSATALVHEAYLRLVGKSDPGWQNRGHFFAAAAEAMRRILIDSARRKKRLRHGGEQQRVDLSDSLLANITGTNGTGHPVDPLALDEALSKLAKEDAPKAELVKLRFFAGLTMEQAGAILGISRATADRWWAYARAFLFCELKQTDEPEA